MMMPGDTIQFHSELAMKRARTLLAREGVLTEVEEGYKLRVVSVSEVDDE